MTRPRTILQREMSDARADYEMSRESRFIRRRTGLAPQGGSGDYHYRTESNYYRDMEKARDMARNDSIVGQITDRVVNNIVQSGFCLEPKTGDPKLDDELFERWRQFAQSPDACDIQGEMTFADMEWLVYRSMLVDGDCFVLGLSEGQLQLIEGHAVQTTRPQPNTVLGVMLNQYRKRMAYWIQEDTAKQSRGARKEIARPINVRDAEGHRQAFHVYDPKRATLTRGVTSYAPIFQLAGMLDDIQFATILKVQVASCIAFIRTKSITAEDLPSGTKNFDGVETVTTAAGGTTRVKSLSPMQEIEGDPGEKIEGFSPNVPNPEYFPHVRMIMQMIGVNLGLPLCLVLMDGSETNFSGWRGAYDEAKKGFRHGQNVIRNRLHRPVYEWKVRQWMADDQAIGRVAKRKGIDPLGHLWRAPAFPYIQPVEEANGKIIRVQGNLAAPRTIAGEDNQDWQEVVDDTIADNAYAIRNAKREAMAINAEFPDDQPVNWRELVKLPLPPGIQLGMQAQVQPQPATQGAA